MSTLQQQIADRFTKAADGLAGRNLSLAEFASSRLWIRPIEGDIVKFKMRPIQKAYLAKKEKAVKAGKPKKYLLLKYRRGGFSTLEQAASYKVAVTVRRANVATLAHTKEATTKISNIAKLFKEMDEGIPQESRRADDRISLTFPHTRSTFFLGTASGQAFGRGDTLQRCHCSEVAWWCEGPNQYTEVDNLVAGLQEATSGGEIVLESTPNGIEWFATTFKQAMSGLNDWTPIFVPWFEDSINTVSRDTFDEQEMLDTMTEEEKELMGRHGLSTCQIQWRRNKKLSLPRLFKQEYPEDPHSCFLTSGTGFFDVDVCMTLIEKHPDFKKRWEDRQAWKTQAIPGGKIVLTEYPDPTERYVLGCDTSEGLSTSDPNGVGVLRHSDGVQVAWAHGRWRPEQLAKIAFDLGMQFNRGLLGVECNNHGHSVLNTLSNVLKYPNLYYQKNERGEPGPGTGGKLGWNTNAVTRPVMLDDLEVLVRDVENALMWRDVEFLDECTTFKLQADGQYRADPGATDDRVMKWAVAYQMRKFNKHRARVILLD